MTIKHITTHFVLEGHMYCVLPDSPQDRDIVSCIIGYLLKIEMLYTVSYSTFCRMVAGLLACLLAYRPSNMLVYLRDGSAQTSVRAATLR